MISLNHMNFTLWPTYLSGVLATCVNSEVGNFVTSPSNTVTGKLNMKAGTDDGEGCSLW